MKIPISNLKPSPVNDVIYSPTDLTELKESIQNFGLLEPIVVSKETKDIISGHRRYYSLQQLGIEEAEVREVEVADESELTIQIIQHNTHRQKTTKDILNESRMMEKELKKKFGGSKRGTRNDLNGKGRFVVVQEIANKLGVGYSQLKKIRSINNYEPELIKKIDTLGGAVKAIEQEFQQNEIASSAIDYQRAIDEGENISFTVFQGFSIDRRNVEIGDMFRQWTACSFDVIHSVGSNVNYPVGQLVLGLYWLHFGI